MCSIVLAEQEGVLKRKKVSKRDIWANKL